MHYIIDGYNLFFFAQTETLPLEEKRTDFVTQLDQLFEVLNLRCTFVFDSGKASHLVPSRKNLSYGDVVFSPSGVSADDYIIEWLTAQTNRAQITIVTSDRQLARRVKQLGAKTQNLQQFFHFLDRQRKKQVSRSEGKEEKATNIDMDRYLKIFENKLKRDE